MTVTHRLFETAVYVVSKLMCPIIPMGFNSARRVTEAQIKAYFDRTLGCKYDWWGVLGIVLGIKQKRSKYFCSQ